MAHPAPLAIEDEMLDYFFSPLPGKRRWFDRKMRDLTAEQQVKVWAILESRGHPRPAAEPEAAANARVAWTEQEWDQLAKAVWHARRNEPTLTLLTLCGRAQDNLPPDRRRVIRATNEVKPLIERLQTIDKAYVAAANEVPVLQARLEKLANIPSKESILAALSDEEIFVHFSDKIMAMLSPDDVLKTYPAETLLGYVPIPVLLSHLATLGMEALQEREDRIVAALQDLKNTTPTKPLAASTSQRNVPLPGAASSPSLPRVTILGLLPNQARVIEQKLSGMAQFNCVDKGRCDRAGSEAIPLKQDIIVLMANFIGHHLTDTVKKQMAGTSTRLIVHHGGIDRIVRRLAEELAAKK
jgi:hypothetical protein